MQIDSRTKIEKAAAKDKSRPALNHPHLNVTTGMIEATNGVIAVRVPVDCDPEDCSGAVSAEALAAARKEGEQLRCAEERLETRDTSYRRPQVGSFPALADLIPAAGSGTWRVALDVDQLAKLAAALGSERVILEGSAPGAPIRVEPYGSDLDGEAVIMPIRVAFS